MVRVVDASNYTITTEDYVVLCKFDKKAVMSIVMDAISLKSLAAYVQARDMHEDFMEYLTLYGMYFSPTEEYDFEHSIIGYNILDMTPDNFDFNKYAHYLFRGYVDNLDITFIPHGKNGDKQADVISIATQDGDCTLDISVGGKSYNYFWDGISIEREDNNNLKNTQVIDELDKIKLKYSLMGKQVELAYIYGLYCFNIFNKRLDNKIIYDTTIMHSMRNKNIKALVYCTFKGEENKRLKILFEHLNYMRIVKLYNVDFRCKSTRYSHIYGKNSSLYIKDLKKLKVSHSLNLVMRFDSDNFDIFLSECHNIYIVLTKPLTSESTRNIFNTTSFQGSQNINFILKYDSEKSVSEIDNYLKINRIGKEKVKVYLCAKDYDFKLGYGGYLRIQDMGALKIKNEVILGMVNKLLYTEDT